MIKIARSTKKLFLLALCVAGLFPSAVFAYDDNTTHPALTEEVVKFYNANFPNQPISSEELEWIIEGSIAEDTAPRWINHFYDPVHKTGWTGDKTGGIASVFTRGFAKASLYTGDPVAAPDWISGFVDQQQMSPYGGNHSWKKGVEDYGNGNRKEAFITLGHILHVLQDMGVPDHTRDDTHANFASGITGDEGSPYEIYAQKYARGQLTTAKDLMARRAAPEKKQTIRNYFEDLATYSNNYFFSKDTINDSKYSVPKIINRESEFAIGLDELGLNFALARVRTTKDDGESKELIFLDNPKDEQIFEGYFSRLSEKIVIYGAGLVHEFKTQGEEQIVNKYFPTSLTKLDLESPLVVQPGISGIGIFANIRNWTSRTGGGISNFFSGLFSGTLNGIRGLGANISGVFSGRDSAGTNQESNIPGAEESQSPTFQDVLRQEEEAQDNQPPDGLEGADASLEKKEDVSEEIDLDLGFVVRVIDGDTIILKDGRIVRYIGIDAPEIAHNTNKADCFGDEAAAFNKSFTEGKVVRLEIGPDDKDGYGRYLRYVFLGDLMINQKLIEEGYARSFSFGRPHEYQKQFDAKQAQAKTAELGLWGSACKKDALDPIKTSSTTASTTAPEAPKPQASAPASKSYCSYNVVATPTRGSVILNEIAWMGTGKSSSDEWLEIKNISNSSVNISNWQLVDKAEQIKHIIKDGTIINPGGFYLLERTDDNTLPAVPADETYSGALSDSSEGIKLFNSNCGLEDEVATQGEGSWPAGNSVDKKSMERQANLGWQTYSGPGSSDIFGTPRGENSIPSSGSSYVPPPPVEDNPSDDDPASNKNHLLISEIQVGGFDDAGDEFIEIYNPNKTSVSLSGWSIQYLSGASAGWGSIKKKNFPSDASIGARGFYLITRGQNSDGEDGYTGSHTPDLSQRTFSLSGADTGGVIFLVQSTDALTSTTSTTIIDMMTYGYPENGIGETDAAPIPGGGESLERLAWRSSECYSAEGEGDFWGNGCDTDVSGDDFDSRSEGQPQNSQSMPEPRSGPIISGLTTSYNSSTFEISISWAAATDISGSTSGVRYSLSDITNTDIDPVSLLDLSDLTNYTTRLAEIGREYVYKLIARDSEGMTSHATTTIQIPGLFDAVNFVPDFRLASSGNYVVDLRYGHLPLAPVYFTNAWHGLVAYLNVPPKEGNDWLDAPNYEPQDTSNVLNLYHSPCNGWGGQYKSSYIYSEGRENCIGGGYPTAASAAPMDVEDMRLIIPTILSTVDTTLTEADYVSFAAYVYMGGESLNMIVRDMTEYHFQAVAPTSSVPTSPTGISSIFSDDDQTIAISWATSTDSDSFDAELTYEVRVSTSSQDGVLWQSAGTSNSFVVRVEFPHTHHIEVRAVDESGNISEAATSSFDFDSGYAPLPRQTSHNQMENQNGFQKVHINQAVAIDGVYLWIGYEAGHFPCDNPLVGGIYSDNEGNPGEILGVSPEQYIPGGCEATEMLFSFPRVELEAGKDYWIVAYLNPDAGHGVMAPVWGGGGDTYVDGEYSYDPSTDLYFRMHRAPPAPM